MNTYLPIFAELFIRNLIEKRSISWMKVMKVARPYSYFHSLVKFFLGLFNFRVLLCFSHVFLNSKQEIVTFPKLESFIHKNLRDEEVNDFWVHSRKNHSCSGKISSMHTNVMNTSWILQLRIINTTWLSQTRHTVFLQ